MRRLALIVVACCSLAATMGVGGASATEPDWTASPTLPNAALQDNGAGGYTLTPAAKALVRNNGYTGSFVGVDGSVDTAAYKYLDAARQAEKTLPTWKTIGASVGLSIALSLGAQEVYSQAIKMNIP